jgi:PAS domain S-box-containing protein
MASARPPENEVARLEALQRYAVLDTPPEAAFDEITELVAYVCGTASALISLVDEKRQWFKARAEFTGTETPRELAFCAFTILQRDVLEVRDAAADPRFADNALVTGEPHIRFYAGAPLITSDGFALGSVAAIDYVPRQLDDAQKRALVVLSHQVVAQLELRRRLVEERKQGELAARQGLERFELVARATNDAVWDWDLGTDAIWWSEGFQTLFGYEREEIGADITSWASRIHPNDQASVQHGIHAVIDGGGTTWSSEYRFRRRDDTYAVVFDRGYVLRDPEGKPVRMIGAMQDITERKRLEEQLRQSQKMDAIGQLSGGIAHDFNNLLTVIQCNAMFLTEGDVSKERRAYAEDIAQAAERAASLTRQLLMLSRRQVMQPTTLDLNEVVQNLMRMLRRIVGEDIHVYAGYASEMPLLRGDVGMLEQVLLNLVVNARDAMPRGGHLTIVTSVKVVDEAEAQRRPEVTAGRYACLEVRDTGGGVDPEALPHVFEPFFTTKPIGKGTGLGLATVYGIVKQHGGWIDVTSEPGTGTIFSIYLPISEPAAAPNLQRASDIAGSLTGTETILVVEDEDGVRLLVVNLLERHGYTVLQAASGPEALEVWQRARDQIDLLLTDLVMPGGMTGRELAGHLRADRPALKVVYTSGYSMEVIGPGESLIDGCNFVQKPYRPDQLAQTVRAQLDGAHEPRP